MGAEYYTVKCWADVIFYDLRARDAVCARGTPRARRARPIHAMTSVRMQPDAVEGDCCPACSQAQWPPLARATSTPNTFLIPISGGPTRVAAAPHSKQRRFCCREQRGPPCVHRALCAVAPVKTAGLACATMPLRAAIHRHTCIHHSGCCGSSSCVRHNACLRRTVRMRRIPRAPR